MTHEEALRTAVQAMNLCMPVGTGPKFFRKMQDVLDHMDEQGFERPKLTRWMQDCLDGRHPQVFKP